MPLAETTTSPAALPPPTRLEIRATEEGPFGNTNKFLTRKGRGSVGELPAVTPIPIVHLVTHSLTYMHVHVL